MSLRSLLLARSPRAAGVLAVIVLSGCGNVVIDANTSGPHGTTTDTTTSGSVGGGGAGGSITGSGAGGTGGEGGDEPMGCEGLPDDDLDSDGYSPAQGDCNDCDPLIGPAAMELPTLPGKTPLDENCNGEIDEPPVLCDSGLAIDSTDPLLAAHAMDVCESIAADDKYGLLSAAWKLPDSTDPLPATLSAFHIGHGLLPDFGPNALPQLGSSLLALSTGVARRPIDQAISQTYDKSYESGAPAGFPIGSDSCGAVTVGEPHDGLSLELDLQPPVNATAIEIHYRFYTHAWPSDVCTQFNDQFAVLLSPSPFGDAIGNIAIDTKSRPLTVSSFTPVACHCGLGGCPVSSPCTDNAALLDGSGFSDFGAATEWLSVTVPFATGTKKLTLRALTYDAGDPNLDTTALVDGFAWRAPEP